MDWTERSKPNLDLDDADDAVMQKPAFMSPV
jgi:hypothetical protein